MKRITSNLKSRYCTILRATLLCIVFAFIKDISAAQAINTGRSNRSEASAPGFIDGEGAKTTFEMYHGKKIWLIVLPDSLSNADTSLLQKMDSIVISNQNKVQTIVVPSISKKSFVTDGGISLAKWYKVLRSHKVIFSVPMSLHKNDKNSTKDDMISWLTTASRNGHFDREISPQGAMFLVDEQGELKGEFSLSSIWNRQYMQIIFQ
ncbi:MAG: hypothetical protein KGO81_01145 [Bacteroidota bacterium]|nr:hypothetical protein [Bacteroidota bacterium]